VSTGRAEQAVREARSVQAEKPKQPFGYVLEGEIYVAQKNWEVAERTYREAIKKFDLPVLVARAHAVLTASGKPAEADKLAGQWIRAHPKDASVLTYLADRDVAARRFESAANRYNSALERAPDSPLLLNNVAWTRHELKRPGALEYAERAYELAPENPAIMDTLGAILAAGDDLERGLELLGRAAELAPQAYPIRLNFAKALLKANRKSAARKELETLAKLDSRLPAQQEAAKLLSGL
jgi:predicted Zn-dependent protease